MERKWEVKGMIQAGDRNLAGSLGNRVNLR